MIIVEKIRDIVEQGLEEDMFIVDIDISKSNVINVYIDSMKGVSINQCASLSRFIESNLDREVEDYELQVSSAGLGSPFKVIQQYQKNIGKEIEVALANGLKHKGTLLEINKAAISVETKRKEKIPGKKKKQQVVEKLIIEFENIKTVKSVITFK